jgi:hypothetical protein
MEGTYTDVKFRVVLNSVTSSSKLFIKPGSFKMSRHKECMWKLHIPAQTAPFQFCNTSVSNSVTDIFCGQFSAEEEEEEEEEDENRAPAVLREEFILPL